MLDMSNKVRGDRQILVSGPARVKLLAVRSEPTNAQDPTPVLCFDFAVTSQEGAIYTHKVYDRTSLTKAQEMHRKYPRKINDRNHPRFGQFMTVEEYLQDQINSFMSTVKHILTKYMEEPETHFKAANWSEFVQKTVALAEQKGMVASDQELYTVLLYNSKGYIQMREYLPFLAKTPEAGNAIYANLTNKERERLTKPETAKAPATAAPDADGLYAEVPTDELPGLDTDAF